MAYPCSSSSAASSDDSDLNDAPSACSFDSLQQDGGVGWGWAWRALVTGCEQGGCGTGWYLFGLLGIDPSVRASALRGASGGGDRGGDGGGEQDLHFAPCWLQYVVQAATLPRPRGGIRPPHARRARQSARMVMRPPARLVFPGGGIFFWWQAGAITSLSKRIDLSTVPCCGASAGSAPRNSRRPAPLVQTGQRRSDLLQSQALKRPGPAH